MNIIECFENTLSRQKKQITDLEDLLPKFKRAAEAVRHAAKFLDISPMILGCQLLIRVKVQKLTDIQPVLECLEEDLGINFDQTTDQASYSWREFKSAGAPWLRVDAELAADGPECRRVIVGYKQEPVYELKCGEDAQTPDAPAPDQGDQE